MDLNPYSDLDFYVMEKLYPITPKCARWVSWALNEYL